MTDDGGWTRGAGAPEREAQWAELFAPQTSAARLSEIAERHPEFADQARRHPNWHAVPAASGASPSPAGPPDRAAPALHPSQAAGGASPVTARRRVPVWLLGIGAFVVIVADVAVLVATGVVRTPLTSTEWGVGRPGGDSASIRGAATSSLGRVPASDPYLTEPSGRWTFSIDDVPDEFGAAAFTDNGQFQLPSGTADIVLAGDGVDGFLFSNKTLYDQSSTRTTKGVVVVDADTGAYKWAYVPDAKGPDGGLFSCAPRSVDGAFVCGNSAQVFLLDEQTGSVRRTLTPTDIEADATQFVVNSLCVDPIDEALYVSVDGVTQSETGEYMAGTGDWENTFALARLADDGDVVWHSRIPAQPEVLAEDYSYRFETDDSRVLVSDGTFGVFSKSDGRVLASGSGYAGINPDGRVHYSVFDPTGTGQDAAMSTDPRGIVKDDLGEAPTNVINPGTYTDMVLQWLPSRRDEGGSALGAVQEGPAEELWRAEDIFSADVLALPQVVIVKDLSGTVIGVRPRTGERLWQSSMDALRGTDANFDSSDGVNLIGSEGMPVAAISSDTEITMLGTGSSAADWLSPSTPAAQAAGVPSCSDGRQLLSWTKWPGGWVIVCAQVDGSQARLQASLPTGVAFTADDVTSDDAWTRFCGASSGRTVCVDGLAQTVETSADGEQPHTWTVEQGWVTNRGDIGRGAGSSAPDQVPSCPSGTVAIGWGTYGDNWVLACGTTDGAPSSLQTGGPSGTESASKVSDESGAICGTFTGGTKRCLHGESRALVTEAADGSRQQQGLDSSWQLGASGGSGAYGVSAPDPTEKDQVRYLSEVLQRSAAARSALQGPVADISACRTSELDGAISDIQGVIDARTSQLDAISAAPVDHIPDGDALITDLRQALQASLAADRSYLSWGKAVAAGGCSEGQNFLDEGDAHSVDAQRAKKAFADRWNTQIVPRHDVPSTSPKTL